MYPKKVAHALVRWIDPNGMPRVAMRGEYVQIPAEAAARLERLGAFEPDFPRDNDFDFSQPAVYGDLAQSPDALEDPMPHEAAAPGHTELAMPKRTDPRQDWEIYARAIGLDGDAVEAMSKPQIIAAVNDQEH